MKRRQKISSFINSGEFEEDSRPDRRTVIAAIKRGELPGERFMGQWWVFRGEIEKMKITSTGNDRADSILRQVLG